MEGSPHHGQSLSHIIRKELNLCEVEEGSTVLEQNI